MMNEPRKTEGRDSSDGIPPLDSLMKLLVANTRVIKGHLNKRAEIGNQPEQKKRSNTEENNLIDKSEYEFSENPSLNHYPIRVEVRNEEQESTEGFDDSLTFVYLKGSRLAKNSQLMKAVEVFLGLEKDITKLSQNTATFNQFIDDFWKLHTKILQKTLRILFKLKELDKLLSLSAKVISFQMLGFIPDHYSLFLQRETLDSFEVEEVPQ